jgi:hypothetical protein
MRRVAVSAALSLPPRRSLGCFCLGCGVPNATGRPTPQRPDAFLATFAMAPGVGRGEPSQLFASFATPAPITKSWECKTMVDGWPVNPAILGVERLP